jgi:hypothetical protein
MDRPAHYLLVKPMLSPISFLFCLTVESKKIACKVLRFTLISDLRWAEHSSVFGDSWTTKEQKSWAVAAIHGSARHDGFA